MISVAHRCIQELGSMYDYLAKIILLGPSGAGKWVSECYRAANIAIDHVALSDRVCCIASSKMNVRRFVVVIT